MRGDAPLRGPPSFTSEVRQCVMTYLYKLAKRVSRIRGAVLPLAALISACAQGSSSDPFNIGPSFAIKSSQYTRISITPRGSQLDLGKRDRKSTRLNSSHEW